MTSQGQGQRRSAKAEAKAKGKVQRPRGRWMDLVKEDMERVGAKEGDEVDRVK